MKYILVPEFIHLVDFLGCGLTFFSPTLQIDQFYAIENCLGRTRTEKTILYVTKVIDAQLFDFQNKYCLLIFLINFLPE